MKKLILFISLIASIPAFATSPCKLGSYSASYTLYSKSMRNLGTHKQSLVINSPSQFTLRGSSDIHFLWVKDHITSQVTGRISKQGITPQNYQFSERRKKMSRKFDVLPGHYDPLSFLLKLRTALISKNTTGSISIPIQSSHDHTKTHTIQFNLKKLPQEALKTKIGVIDTVKISYSPTSHVLTTYWLAPKLGYLPVKIITTKGGSPLVIDIINSYQAEPSRYCLIH